MKLSLKRQHLKRYKDLARLFWKFGRSDMVQQFGLEEALDESEKPHPTDGARPEDLVDELERMGPTFVKFGQILSSRPDLFPDHYLNALRRLQDRVKPFAFEEVEKTVLSELGVRISKAFSKFDPEPMAAASLGQVHRAALRDGRPVVVKVQRPDIRRQVIEDMEMLEEIAAFADAHFQKARRYQFVRIIEEFRNTLFQELDYEREADNLKILGKNLAEFPHLRIPQPIDDYTTRSLLTMEYVQGCKITKLNPVVGTEIDGSLLAEELFRAYLKQVLVDGLFHADPHPGNVFLTNDHKVALLDLGMVGRISPETQEQLLKVLIAISEGHGDQAADIVLQMSETTPDFEEANFRRRAAQLVAEQKENTLRRLEIGKSLLQVGRTAGETGLLAPTELTLLGKTLLQLDEIGQHLDPEFNPNASIRRHLSDIMNKRLEKSFTPGNLVSGVLEMKDFVSQLPLRLNRILDAVAGAELELKVKATDVSDLLDSLHKLVNRITAGLILAAMIVGAALLMQVHTDFQLFGLPGIGIAFFFLAAGGGCWLLLNILVSDRQKKKKFLR